MERGVLGLVRALGRLLVVLCWLSCEDKVSGVTLPESLLFVSTLDGSLHAVSKQSGDIKWTLREDPVIQVPVYLTEPGFLPDPNDGSLYILGGKHKEGLVVKHEEVPEGPSGCSSDIYSVPVHLWAPGHLPPTDALIQTYYGQCQSCTAM